MNLEFTLSLYAGGPGSGCQGPNCGRHTGPFTSKKEAIAEANKRREKGEDVKVYMRSGTYTQPLGKGRGVESYVEYYVAPPGYADKLK